MRQQTVGAADRAGQKLRKEGNEKGVDAEVAFRPYLAAVNVYQVSHGLKEIEGDAGGQQDPARDRLYVQTSGVDQQIEPFYHGICGLIEKQNEHKGKDAAEKTAALGRDALRFLEAESQRVGQDSGRQKQDAVSDMQIHIEQIACREQKTPSVSVGNTTVQYEYHYDKKPKRNGVEQHKEPPGKIAIAILLYFPPICKL